MKRTICILISAALLMSVFHTAASAAYEPPARIWDSFNKYAAAIETGDNENIIKYGKKDLEILLSEPENPTTLSWISARYQNIAHAYEKIGEYEKSAEMYKKQIPYAEKLSMRDSLIIAKAKSLHFASYLDLYEKTYTPQVMHNAKNEHRAGVLFGIPADSKTDQSECSEKLIYLEYGDSEFRWIESELQDANNKKMAVNFAFNLPGQGADIEKVLSGDKYISSVARLLGKYHDIKYFVRFGSEFDIWENKADPEGFKAAFKKVSTIIRSSVPNAAMVFSPNYVSSWDVDVLDYYPGDEYVDWIGMSLYMMPYFQGKKERAENADYLNAVFCAGYAADPVLVIKRLYDIFGDRKPFMISESGAAHYVNTVGEDTTEWAKKHLQMLYGYAPMVYPGLKIITHFDTVIKGEVNNYALKENEEILNTYKKLTSGDIFIKRTPNLAKDISYKRLGDTIYTKGNSIELSAYAHAYTHDDLKINYYLDGKWLASSVDIPYTKTLDLGSVSKEKPHTLSVTAESEGKELIKKNYTLIVSQEDTPKKNESIPPSFPSDLSPEIKVLCNGEYIIFPDQRPVIINDRTLVPLRAIFEKLGAEVNWNGNEKRVTAEKSNISIAFTIGRKELYKNGVPITLDVPAMLLNDRTMVPVRAVSEAFGAEVGWDQASRTVIIKNSLEK